MGKTVCRLLKGVITWKHPHERGEELHYCYITVALLETPPRAWGRVNAPCVQAMSNGNTPTGVGKSVIAKHNGKNSQKHPHGRGEEGQQSAPRRKALETPPRAWGRVACSVEFNVEVGNTPTGVGKRAHSNFKQFEYYSIFFSFVKEPGSVCADFSIISCSPDMDVKSFVGMPFA